jgi:PIN domain nuclease of toxin-antitoxin system
MNVALIEDPRNERVVSAVTSWEVAIKYATGRLSLPEPPERYVPDRIRRLAAYPLAIEHDHALAVARLPHFHRDPFDRLLVAQAQAMNLTILTGDPAIEQYPVDAILIGD